MAHEPALTESKTYFPEWMSEGRVLSLAFGIIPVLSIVAPRGLAVVLPLAAILGGASALTRGRLGRPPRTLGGLVVITLAWAAISFYWAETPELVWPAWRTIALMAVAGLVLFGVSARMPAGERERIASGVFWGVVIALGVLAFEIVVARAIFGGSIAILFAGPRHLQPYVFNRAAVTLALFVWPAALVVWRRRGALSAIGLIAATAIVIAPLESQSALVGVLAGLAVCGAAWLRPRLTALVLAAGLAGGVALAPAIPHLPVVADWTTRRDISVSVYHRLEIWTFVADTIAERPLRGWGLNSSRDLPGGEVEIGPGIRRISLHPHNAYLQLWLELGAIGATLGTLLVLLGFDAARRCARPGDLSARNAASLTIAQVAAAAIMVGISYGLWQAWWMADLWLAAAVSGVLTSRLNET